MNVINSIQDPNDIKIEFDLGEEAKDAQIIDPNKGIHEADIAIPVLTDPG